MSVSGRYTGASLYVQFAGTAIGSYSRSFEQEEEIGLEGLQNGPAGSATIYTPKFLDGRGHLEVVALHHEFGLLWDVVKPGTFGLLIWGEEGNTAGCPSHSVYAAVMSRRKLVPYDGVVTIEVEFQFSGTVTDSSF